MDHLAVSLVMIKTYNGASSDTLLQPFAATNTEKFAMRHRILFSLLLENISNGKLQKF